MREARKYHPPLPRQTRSQPQTDREEPLIADRSGFNIRYGRFDIMAAATNGTMRNILLGAILIFTGADYLTPKKEKLAEPPGGVSVQLPASVNERLEQMGVALEQINSKLNEPGFNNRRILTRDRKPKAKPEPIPTPLPEPFSRNRSADLVLPPLDRVAVP